MKQTNQHHASRDMAWFLPIRNLDWANKRSSHCCRGAIALAWMSSLLPALRPAGRETRLAGTRHRVDGAGGMRKTGLQGRPPHRGGRGRLRCGSARQHSLQSLDDCGQGLHVADFV